MATTTNQAISKHLIELSDTEMSEVLEYLQNYSILGNSVLEGLYLAQVNSAKSLAAYEARIEAIQAKTDQWASSLEPRLQAQAEGFFDGMTEFVAQQTVALHQAGQALQHSHSSVVASATASIQAAARQHQVELDGRFKALEAQFSATAKSERTKVTGALVATLKEKLEPHVEAAFKDSSDKFSVWSMGRDVLVMTIAFGIALGVKAWLF